MYIDRAIDVSHMPRERQMEMLHTRPAAWDRFGLSRRSVLAGLGAAALAPKLLRAQETNWPLSPKSNRSEALGWTANNGTLITAGSANVKGTPILLGTTEFPYSSFILSLTRMTVGPANYQFDLALDSGNVNKIVSDLYFEQSSTSAFGLFVPVAVPSGSTLYGTLQSTGAAATLRALVTGFAPAFGGTPGASQMPSLTDLTSTAPTNSVALSGTTPTAWTVIGASTPAQVSELIIVPSRAGTTTRVATTYLVDIGVGGGGSERLLASLLMGSTTQFILNPLPTYVRVPLSLASASRLVFRVTCAGADTDNISFAASGLRA